MGGGPSLSCSHSLLYPELSENVPQVIEQWPFFFPLTPPLSSPFSEGAGMEGGSSCHWLSRVCWGRLIGCRSTNSSRTKSGHSSSPSTVKSILGWKCPEQQGKASWRGCWALCWGFCAPMFTVSWGWPRWESKRSIVEGGRRNCSSVLQTFYPSYGEWGHFPGFVGVPVTTTCDCVFVSHQVWEGCRWSRVPQPWFSRKVPVPRCGAIFPPLWTMCSGFAKILEAASSTCFTFLQGQSGMET